MALVYEVCILKLFSMMMQFSVLLFLFVIAADGAYEGDYCGTGGVTGICTKISGCPSAIEDIKHRRPVKNCGFGTEPIVCCVQSPAPATTTTTVKPVITTTKRTLSLLLTAEYDYEGYEDKSADGCEPIPPSLTAPKTGRKAWDRCIGYQEKLVFPCNKSNVSAGGLSRSNRCHHNADELIVGGKNAGLHEFPHMALLGYGDDVNALEWLCGGSLISENFVLTAGHCIAGARDIGPVTYVQLGILRRSDDVSGRHRYKVKRIIPHPKYASPGKYNDIALLELENSVPLDEFIVPACLHMGDPVDESQASATGWGLTQYGGQTSDILQKVFLEKFTTPECAAKYSPNRKMLNGFDEDTQICYGDKTMSKDACQGDNGGPLQVRNKQIACMYTLVGVTSIGISCGSIGEPGLYTKVFNYLAWIENIVWP